MIALAGGVDSVPATALKAGRDHQIGDGHQFRGLGRRTGKFGMARQAAHQAKFSSGPAFCDPA